MARTLLRGGDQIQNYTVLREDLVLDFLGGSNWNLTNGAQNATITGLAAGVNPSDVVIKSQLDALAAVIGSPMRYKGQLDASIPNPDLDAIDNYVGDMYVISVSGTFLGVEFTAGDFLVVNKDVAAGTTITSADIDKIDNTESSDILRTGDVVDNLTSTGVTDAPLSANQGFVLKGLIDALDAQVHSFKYGENKAVTNNSAVIPALLNVPVAGTEQVFLNGSLMERGAGNDYTISGANITFEFVLHTNDKVLVHYQY